MSASRIGPTVAVVLVASAALLAGFPTAAAEPKFDEREVFMDPEDYDANGALDLTGGFVSENVRYDFDRFAFIGYWLNFRLSVRSLDELSNIQMPVIFTVVATVNGTEAQWRASVSTTDNGQATCNEVTAPCRITEDGLVFELPYDTWGFVPGADVTNVWAYTTTSTGAPTYHDVAPVMGNGLPSPSAPSAPATLGAFMVEGPFCYAVATPLEGLTRMSVRGAAVDIDFEVSTCPGVMGEIVRFYFDVPKGWTVEPSRGSTTPAGPVGEITNLAEGTTIDFTVTVSSNIPQPNGTIVVIPMEMVSLLGAYEVFNLVVQVTESKIEDPAYNFTLLSGSSFTKEESSMLSFGVSLVDGSELPNGTLVRVDFVKDGQVVETVDAVMDAPGMFSAEYAFPSDGAWIADVYVADLSPSPHAEFPISVAGGVLGAPGPGAALALLALVGALLVFRRRD